MKTNEDLLQGWPILFFSWHDHCYQAMEFLCQPAQSQSSGRNPVPIQVWIVFWFFFSHDLVLFLDEIHFRLLRLMSSQGSELVKQPCLQWVARNLYQEIEWVGQRRAKWIQNVQWREAKLSKREKRLLNARHAIARNLLIVMIMVFWRRLRKKSK